MLLNRFPANLGVAQRLDPKLEFPEGTRVRCFAREVAHGLQRCFKPAGTRGQAQSPLFGIGGDEMVWLFKVGVIATVCVLVFRPDIVTAFWATVTILFVIYVVIDLLGDWIDRILLGKNSRKERRRRRHRVLLGKNSRKEYHRRRGGRRKEDRIASS